MEEVIEGYNFRVVVRDGLFKPVFDGEALVTPRYILELDALYGLFGDRISGILLAPIARASPHSIHLIEAYRERVVCEERVWLDRALGSIARVSLVKPELYPLLRMVRLSNIYCEVYIEALRRLGVEALSYARLAPACSGWRAPLSIPAPIGYRRGPCEELEAVLSESLRSLARLPEGWLSLGYSSYEALVEPYVGKPASCSRVNPLHSILTCSGPGGLVAVKDYKLSSLKWIPAFLASSTAYRFQRDPRDRAATELCYSKLLRGVVRTPRILTLHVDGGVIAVKEYLEGSPVLGLPDTRAWRLTGRALARIHEAGYTLGDANPGNFLALGEGLALVDLEQARRATVGGMAWDIVTVLAYSHLMGVDSRLVKSLLEEYASSIGGLRGPLVEELLKPRYWLPYIAIPYKAPEALNIVRSTLAK